MVLPPARAVVLIFSLAAGGSVVTACRDTSPASCSALLECCEVLPNPTTSAQCTEAVERGSGEAQAESACASALDVYQRTGACGNPIGGGDAGRPGSDPCDDLRGCCNQISSGPILASCLSNLDTFEKGDRSLCRDAIVGYTRGEWCALAGYPGPERSEATCQDHLDNDQNGAIDCADPGCEGTNACRARVDAGIGTEENTNDRCSDGISNDGDRYVDCADYDCSRNPAVTVCGTTLDAGSVSAESTDALCSDGISNDGDRYVDCDDFDCTKSTSVTVCAASCSTCVDAATSGPCAATFQACGSMVACQALLQCVGACSDSACSATCRTEYPSGTQAFDALTACLDSQCAGACD